MHWICKKKISLVDDNRNPDYSGFNKEIIFFLQEKPTGGGGVSIASIDA